MPRVTVVMSVYNASRFLGEAISSILAQTFQNFEFIIVDDGSEDGSRSVIESFADPRIRLISCPHRGIPASLNEGVALARGQYIARQDADDISLPTRLEREVAVLDGDARIGLVGSTYVVIHEDGAVKRPKKVFTHPDDLALAQLVSNQFGGGAVMMRREVLEQVGRYALSAEHGVEDYDLFTRIARVARIANIGEPLYLLRRHPESISVSRREEQYRRALEIRDREFKRLLTNRKCFRVASSVHPFGYHFGWREYARRKARLFRSVAYLYQTNGRWRSAAGVLLLAIVYGPGQRHNYNCLVSVLRNRTGPPSWEYEWA